MMRDWSQSHLRGHLSNDELLRQVYGVGAGSAHLRECAECSARMEAWLRTKARLRIEAEARMEAESQPLASSAFFAAQRRAVYGRLDRPAASYVRWAPAVACAALLAVGLLLLPRAPVRAPRTPIPSVRVDAGDNDQLFSDLYSMEQSVEPSVDAPIRELFQESAAGGEQ